MINIYTSGGTEIALQAVRDAILTLLAECTESQQVFFHRLYPGGVESLGIDKLNHALDQCQRTIKRNRAVTDVVNG